VLVVGDSVEAKPYTDMVRYFHFFKSPSVAMHMAANLNAD
jgi:hypothetical protein